MLRTNSILSARKIDLSTGANGEKKLYGLGDS